MYVVSLSRERRALLNRFAMIEIATFIDLPEDEVTFRFVPSRGPGGQNVNKVATAVILSFDLAASRALSESQRSLLRSRLASRLHDDVLMLRCEKHRTQAANRREVIRRFVELMSAALRPPKKRRPTRPTRASVERRLKLKQQRSLRKRERRRPPGREE